MKLLLVRHGNTFGPGVEPTWVGAREDLPLVESGYQQARAVGDLIWTKWAWDPSCTHMRVGPLQRTLQSADEILSAGETLSGKKLASRKIDERLREVDYGLWGGLTRKATVERFGEESVRAYEVEGKFPTGAGWPESEETIRARVLSLIRELETDRDEKKNWILVSSQGILRFFLDPVDLADRLRTGRHKIRTGAVALFERSTLPSSRWELQFWDLRPEEVKN